jgi:hypothetical protein
MTKLIVRLQENLRRAYRRSHRMHNGASRFSRETGCVEMSLSGGARLGQNGSLGFAFEAVDELAWDLL